jgi:iron complex outermembrane receptor protein
MKTSHTPRLQRLMVSGAALPMIFAVGAAAPAAAQAPAAAPAPAVAPSDKVSEVVVTAQFRSQNIQQTPLAITAVTADMLLARSQTNVAQVAQASPGLNMTTGSLGGAQTTSISIRGIGQSDFNLAVEPGVGMYIDDVYYGTMFGSLFDLVDVDRVEVLRGPQGTLSGKNSEGGAVKIYSKKPTASDSAYIESTFGTYNRREVRAAANYTVVPDKLFARVTGLGEFEEGYVKRYDYQCQTGQPPSGGGIPASMALSPKGFGGGDACLLGREGGKNVLGLRASLRWVPNENVEDTLIYDDLHDRSDPPPYIETAQGSDWRAADGSVAANFATPGKYYTYSTFCGLAGTPNQYCVNPTNALDSWGVSNDLAWKLGGGVTLKSISAYRAFIQHAVSDTDGMPLTGTQNSWNLDYKQYSQEIRLSGDVGERIKWTLGGYYFKSDALQGARVGIDGAGNIIRSATGVPTTFDFLEFDPVKVESKSVFAHVELKPIEKLTITGGVRYTDDYKFFQYGRALPPGYAGSLLTASVTPLNGVQGTFRGGRVDYRVTADYQFTPDVSAYFQTATGYKGGGFSPRPFYPQQAVPFNPEANTVYEVGLKSFLFDHKVRLNAAAYINKYTDLQLTLSYCPDFAPQNIPIIARRCAMNANVGNADIMGGEVEAEIHPFPGALIDFAGSYTDFKYTKLDTPTLKTRIPLSSEPPYVPALKFNVGAQYKYDVGTAGSLTPRVDVAYLGRQQTAQINNAAAVIPAYALVNARMTWQSTGSDWSVSLSATNLLDKYYYTTYGVGLPPAINASPLTGQNIAQVGAPRRVAVTVRKTF